jgi:lysylphosphatidylglycerol synthetase-like protein (DUF2156 family)
VRWRELRFADLHAVVPFAIGLLGILNLLSAIWPREPAMMRELARWLPLEVTQRSRAVMLLAGLALLQVTRNLGRRKTLAWGVAVAALSVSLVSHTLRAFDLHHSLVAALLLAYLLAFRSRFSARSDPASLRQALVMARCWRSRSGCSGSSGSRTCSSTSAGIPATRRRSRRCAPAC